MHNKEGVKSVFPNLLEFDEHCCVFRPAFGCCAHFFQSFLIFFVHLNLFHFFVHFRTQLGRKYTRMYENGIKKTRIKSNESTFWVRAAPKSWLKYITEHLLCFHRQISSINLQLRLLLNQVPERLHFSPKSYLKLPDHKEWQRSTKAVYR